MEFWNEKLFQKIVIFGIVPKFHKFRKKAPFYFNVAFLTIDRICRSILGRSFNSFSTKSNRREVLFDNRCVWSCEISAAKNTRRTRALPFMQAESQRDCFQNLSSSAQHSDQGRQATFSLPQEEVRPHLGIKAEVGSVWTP